MTLTKPFLTKLILAAMLTMALIFTFSIGNMTYAQDTTSACEGIGIAGGTCNPTTGESAISKIVNTVINILSLVVGAISVIMIIVGGLRYVTSAGDSSKTVAARNTIIYAVVGLVVVIFARAIVSFVVGRINSTS